MPTARRNPNCLPPSWKAAILATVELKRALITGASSGIGRATAERLAERGMDLILLARRRDRLEELQKQIEKAHSVRVFLLVADIRDSGPLQVQMDTLLPEISKVDVLINCAGLALGTSKIQESDPTDWDQMIDTNVKGLLTLTRRVLPYLLKAPQAHIVNLGSVAGRWVYAGGAVYCASKFAVRAISEGLRMDLLGTSIRVTNIEPGMVDTEFSQVRLKDKDKAKAVYAGMNPLSAADIAECIEWSLSRPKHVNIQEMVIYPADQVSVGMVHRR